MRTVQRDSLEEVAALARQSTRGRMFLHTAQGGRGGLVAGGFGSGGGPEGSCEPVANPAGGGGGSCEEAAELGFCGGGMRTQGS